MNAIEVHNVSKKYILHREKPTLLKDLFLRPFKRHGTTEEFWALKNINFEIKKGETVGIIGENGAGKSTMLKILTGVTRPTSGTVKVNGRVGALLELGAGFHPDLTGRENVYLNGSILGLSKKDIDRKFDGIVDFSGIEEFIDTPVRTYSSGMFVRLGFSVAVHMEPEILIIDEVLAVGDAAFRKRCLEQIDIFIKGGKTVIIVTHSIQEIQRIVRRVLLFQHGVIQADGPLDKVAAHYISPLSAKQLKIENAKSLIEIVNVELCDGDGKPQLHFQTHDELQVHIRFIAYQRLLNPIFRVQIYRSDGLFCHGMNTGRHDLDVGEIYGDGIIILRYKDLGLLSGNYSFHIAVFSNQHDDLPIHQVIDSREIYVESKKVDGGGVLAMPTQWIIETKNQNRSNIQRKEINHR